MGQQSAAQCLDCGKNFVVSEGGGFLFHLARCEKCGETKAIAFDDLGELHLRYLKGLRVPYCIATAKHDEEVQKHGQFDPISEDEYHKGIETIAGKCRCGGEFTLTAPPRCPECHSTRIAKKNEMIIMYD